MELADGLPPAGAQPGEGLAGAELLNFYRFPRHLWKKPRTANAIERCFVEIRRRTRPLAVFTNVQSVDGIVYAIFHRFNEDWQTAPSSFLHKELDDIDCAKALLIGKGHVYNPGNSQIKKGILGCRPRASLL